MRPLNQDGSLSLSFYDPSDDHLKERIPYQLTLFSNIFFHITLRIGNSSKLKRLVYLYTEGCPLLRPPEQIRGGERRELVKNGKKRFIFKRQNEKSLRQKLNDPQHRSRLISGPTNFEHVVHMGPEQAPHFVQSEPSLGMTAYAQSEISSRGMIHIV